MKEAIRQAIDNTATHPKATILVTALFTSNAWLDYGEPIIRGLTTVFGLFVLVLVAVKHVLDIKKEISKKDDEE